MKILKGIIIVGGLTTTYLLGHLSGMKRVARALSTTEKRTD